MNVDTIAVQAVSLYKNYEIGEMKIEILQDVNLIVKREELVVVDGPSGSGKTTLLNLVGGIDRPTSGKIRVFGEELTEKDEDSLSNFRLSKVGIVFQSYNLVSTLTVSENIAFPMEWVQKPPDFIKKKVGELLDLVNLENRADHFPFQLSGGEQQRVAFARALANDPPLLLADEPTGNLDAKTGGRIVALLEDLRNLGKTILIASHDSRILRLAGLKLHLEDRKLVISDE
jgi:putative ABC transport system ATP-binding protein